MSGKIPKELNLDVDWEAAMMKAAEKAEAQFFEELKTKSKVLEAKSEDAVKMVSNTEKMATRATTKQQQQHQPQ